MSCRAGRRARRQASERRARPGASGELPRDWPLPYDAAATLAACGARAAESLDEQAGRTPATPPRPCCPAGSIGWAAGSARWRRTAGWCVSTDQASRVGELLEEAGMPDGGRRRAARGAAAGRDRAGPRIAERGFGARAQRACWS